MKNRIISWLKSLWGSALYYYSRRLYNKDPRLAADVVFKRVYGRPMNLDNPKHLIEKITWLQFHTDTSLWTLCADKYRVREYVEKCGLGERLPKLYGHWEKLEDVNFEGLPAQFVIKANNGCGSVKIVKDKSQSDLALMKKTMRKWLKRPFGYVAAQTHYLRIKPCILAEELLPNIGPQASISPSSLVDYKIWCFNGRPECCIVTFDRGKFTSGGKLKMDIYDTRWNRIDNVISSNRHYERCPEIMVPRPKCWDEMLKIAETLSRPFPEVRVDLYDIGGEPVIGELTFSSGYGYLTEDYYNYLGSKIDIEELKKRELNGAR